MRRVAYFSDTEEGRRACEAKRREVMGSLITAAACGEPSCPFAQPPAAPPAVGVPAAADCVKGVAGAADATGGSGVKGTAEAPPGQLGSNGTAASVVDPRRRRRRVKSKLGNAQERMAMRLGKAKHKGGWEKAKERRALGPAWRTGGVWTRSTPPPPSRPWTSGDVARLATMKRAKKSYEVIARRLHRAEESVTDRYKALQECECTGRAPAANRGIVGAACGECAACAACADACEEATSAQTPARKRPMMEPPTAPKSTANSASSSAGGTKKLSPRFFGRTSAEGRGRKRPRSDA